MGWNLNYYRELIDKNFVSPEQSEVEHLIFK